MILKTDSHVYMLFSESKYWDYCIFIVLKSSTENFAYYNVYVK